MVASLFLYSWVSYHLRQNRTWSDHVARRSGQSWNCKLPFSTTTPIRVVFDCSCRQSSNSPCLNDCLLIGLLCDNDLGAILLHFRSYYFGISTDIKKAFLHARLHPNDQDFTWFFSGYLIKQIHLAYSVCIASKSCHLDPLCLMQCYNITSGTKAHVCHLICVPICMLTTLSLAVKKIKMW